MSIVLDGTNGITGPATKEIVGTTTNDSAAAGYVGEYIESIASGVSLSLSGGGGNNVTTISLTAGDWDVTLACYIDTSGATVTTSQITISKYSGSDNTDRVYGSNWLFTFLTGSVSGVVPPYRVSISSTTTVYAKWAGSYSGSTPTMSCRLSARRVR